MLFPERHICHQSVEEISEISKRAFGALGLDVLFYGEIIDEDHGFLFYSDKSFFQNRFSMDIPLAGTFLNEGFYTWEDTQPNDLIKLAAEHNYQIPVNIVIEQANSKRIITLAFNGAGKASLSAYLNQKDDVLARCHYFMGLMTKLSKRARKEAVMIPSKLKQHIEQSQITVKDTQLKLEPIQWMKSLLFSNLSEREIEVFLGVILGKSSKTIAEELALNAKTVDTYIARIKSKLALNSRYDIIKFAWDQGIIRFVMGA